MNALPSSAINPLHLAGKLAAIHNRTVPGLAEGFEGDRRNIEALWYIQAMSAQPGGLGDFCRRVVKDFPEHFITAEMKDRSTARARYDFKGLTAVWRSFPSGVLWHTETDPRFAAILNNSESANQNALRRDGVEAIMLNALTPDFFARLCQQEAADGLADVLRTLCLSHEATFNNTGHVHDETGPMVRSWKKDWWTAGLRDLLLAVMERHAAQAARRIAQTAVVKEVWDALDYAWHTRGFVTVEGNTRFGKTEAVRTWCEMYPGRARYLAAPYSSTEKELLAEVAASFRLPYNWTTPEAKLREELSFVLRYGGVGVFVDEGQWLLPTRYTKTSSPHRLNWFRTQLVDAGVTCALCYTSQFTKDLARYVKSTGYVADQWLGRPKLNVVLPDKLPKEDQLAVARAHLPWCSRPVQLKVASRALTSPSFLKAMQNVADMAQWLARKAGQESATEADAVAAMDKLFPEPLVAPAPILAEEPDPSRTISDPSAKTARLPRVDTFPSNRLAPDPLSLVPTG